MTTVQPRLNRGDHHEADAAGEGRQLRENWFTRGVLGENRKLVIQGYLVDQDTQENLVNFLAGEGAVEIDLDIVRAALAHLM